MTPFGKSLVIVPCARKKVWDRDPDSGPTIARGAYIGPLFRTNCAYAEAHGDAWVILSAKYGLLAPDHVIPEPYDVTFKDLRTEPVTVAAIRQQIVERGLDAYDTVVGLGGRAYRNVVADSFVDLVDQVQFPFAGLPIGKYMQAVKRATTQVEERSSDEC